MDWLLVTVLGLTLALLAPAIASAATLKVATDGVDESTCLEDACASIEYAMGLAESGDY